MVAPGTPSQRPVWGIAGLTMRREDRVNRRLALAAVLAACLTSLLSWADVGAQERRTFRGCAVEQTADSLTLALGRGERVAIGTAWLSADDLSAALVDCVTVVAVRQLDGSYMAESIEAGDEPNEVNSLTQETTRDRERQHSPDDDDDD